MLKPRELSRHFPKNIGEGWRPFFSIRLSEIIHTGESLPAVMQEISNKAKTRGLKPEILDSMLNDE